MKHQIIKKYSLRVIVALLVLAVSSFTAYCDMIVAPNVPVSRQEKTAWMIGILAVLLLLLVLTVIRIRKSRHKKLGWILLACVVALGAAIAGITRINRTVSDPVDLRLEQNGMQILEGTFSGKNSFPIQVPEDGEVSITITGRKASGKVQYQLVQQ